MFLLNFISDTEKGKNNRNSPFINVNFLHSFEF